MSIQCPKCGGEHVQAVKVILQTGTSFSSGTMSGVGVGTDSGIYVGTTSGTSTTHLAARFKEPRKPSKLEVIGTGVMALVSTPWLAATGPDVGFRYLNLALWAIFVWFVISYRKRLARYNDEYPRWKVLYDRGFFCHKCGNVFMK